MPDENPSLDVTARFDPSAIVVGAEQAKKAIKDVAAETEVAAEASEKAAAASDKETESKEKGAAASDVVASESKKSAEATESLSEASEKSAQGMDKAEQKAARLVESLQKAGIITQTATESAEKNAAALAAEAVEAEKAAEATEDSAQATRIKGATDEIAAEGSEELTAAIQAQRSAMMSNVFAAHRLMEGFKDLSEGGRLASQGMVDLEETLGRFLPPQAQVALAIASAVGLLAMMATRHRGAAGAAKEHGEEEKKAAEAIDKGSEALIKFAASAANVHLEVQTETLKDFLKVQEQLVANQDRLDASADAHLQHIQAQTKATQDLAMAELKRQEALDLQAAAGDEQKQARIKLQYEGRENALKGGDEQEANLAEQTLLSQQKQEDDAKRATLLDQNLEKQRQLKALQDDAATKAAKAQGEGFQPNEAGSFEHNITMQDEKVKKAAEDYATAQADLDAANKKVAEAQAILITAHATGSSVLIGAANLGLTSAQTDQRGAQIGVAKAQTDSITAQSQERDLLAAQGSREALAKDGPALQAAIEKTSAEIDKLVSKLDDIYSRQTVLSTESKVQGTATGTAAIENQTATLELQNKQVDDNAKELVRKKKEADEQDKKADDNDFKKEKAPLGRKVEQDREAIAAFEAAAREAADHNATVVGMVKQHAQQTAAANAATKAQLDELRAELARDQASVRQLEQKHVQAQTNALN